jgi:hypothetical protein
VVASPRETKPLLDGGGTAAAVAGQLGASSYIELAAARAGRAVRLSGALYGRDGASLYRAQTFGPSLDEMDGAIAALAHALIWRQPVVAASVGAAGSGVPAAELPAEKAGGRRSAHGPKLGLVMPWASGTAFSPSFSIQYDGRFGSPDYFVELGAGLVIPFDDQPTGDRASVTVAYLELGASRYLWNGDAAPYLGAGVSPAVWATHAWGESEASVTGMAYVQLGMEFNRSRRARFYGEVRLFQTLLAVASAQTDEAAVWTGWAEPRRPLLVFLQGGVGW